LIFSVKKIEWDCVILNLKIMKVEAYKISKFKKTINNKKLKTFLPAFVVQLKIKNIFMEVDYNVKILLRL